MGGGIRRKASSSAPGPSLTAVPKNVRVEVEYTEQHTSFMSVGEEQLRSYEGDDVRVLCDNPDGLNAIECNGAWTDYADLRIEGQNTYSCLVTASGMHTDYYHDKNPELTAPVTPRVQL